MSSVTAQPRPLVTDVRVLIRVPSPAIGEIARLKDNHERKGKIVFIVKNMKKNFGVRKQLLYMRRMKMSIRAMYESVDDLHGDLLFTNNVTRFIVDTEKLISI